MPGEIACINGALCQATGSHAQACPRFSESFVQDAEAKLTPNSSLFTKLVVPFAESAPEAAYILGVGFGGLKIPQLYGLAGELIIGWDYWDGVCSILVGIDLIRKGEPKLGALNILNGLQLLVATWTFGLYTLAGGSVVLAPISFALAMAVDLYSMTKEIYRAANEVKVESWFAAKVKMVNKLEKRIAKTTSNNAKERFEIEKTNILVEMGCRYRVAKSLVGETAETKKLDEALTRFTTPSNKKILNKNSACTADDRRVDQLIQAAATKRYHKAKYTLPIKALSFASMSLFAVSSFVVLFGLACPLTSLATISFVATIAAAVVAAYYLKHFASKYYHRNKKEKKDQLLHNCKVSAYSIFKKEEHAAAQEAERLARLRAAEAAQTQEDPAPRKTPCMELCLVM